MFERVDLCRIALKLRRRFGRPKKRGDAAWEDCVAFVSSYRPHHGNRESRTGSDVVITRISCPTQDRAIKVPLGTEHSFWLHPSMFQKTYRPNQDSSLLSSTASRVKST